MSNLLKKGSAVYAEERIIDYNDILKKKIQTQMALSAKNRERMDADGFVNGLDAEVLEMADASDGLFEETAVTEEMPEVNLDSARQQADEIISEANNMAEEIISAARSKADDILNDARQSGYSEGVSQAKAEYEQKNKELDDMYQEKQDQLLADYNEKVAKIEPELVDTLMDVFAKVTHTIAEDNHDVILHLINGVMKNADTSHEFLIKVSSEDYNFVVNNQGKIYCAMSNDINMDITQDSTLKSNECIIETDTGVFNCSLDIELNNLIKNIKLLSCV